MGMPDLISAPAMAKEAGIESVISTVSDSIYVSIFGSLLLCLQRNTVTLSPPHCSITPLFLSTNTFASLLLSNLPYFLFYPFLPLNLSLLPLLTHTIYFFP